jgi:sugar phosphate isomerase/epimerase
MSTDRFAEVCARAGARSVELRTLGRSESPASLAAATRREGLRVESICGLMDWALPDDPDPRPALEGLLDVATAVGAPLVVCVLPIRHGEMPSVEAIVEMATERLTPLAGVARTLGVRLALEQVGRSSSRPGATSGIRRLRDALAIAERSGDDVALTIDSYNIATADEPYAEIERIPLNRIGIAQIADSAPGSSGRGVPGEGDLDLPGFVRSLDAIAYEGPLSLEIFPSDPWPDPDAFAARAVRAIESLLVENT